MLEEIKARERSMVEITGLIKLSDTRPAGVGLAGGRVRIAPASPMGRGGVPQDPGPQPPVIDVESRCSAATAACRCGSRSGTRN